jgi:hypothetical protein
MIIIKTIIQSRTDNELLTLRTASPFTCGDGGQVRLNIRIIRFIKAVMRVFSAVVAVVVIGVIAMHFNITQIATPLNLICLIIHIFRVIINTTSIIIITTFVIPLGSATLSIDPSMSVGRPIMVITDLRVTRVIRARRFIIMRVWRLIMRTARAVAPASAALAAACLALVLRSSLLLSWPRLRRVWWRLPRLRRHSLLISQSLLLH